MDARADMDMDGTMAATFLGHGSPMNALERNRFTETWRSLGASVPRPRGIVVVSAHWMLGATAVTAMARPRTIHDFHGFPRELFAVEYPAPGDPALAEEVAEAARPSAVGLDHEWGLDHGAWSVLVHAFPRADVPVVQLSLHAGKSMEEHLELGARLAPLRASGVLILASGNVVHDLRSIEWSARELGFDWARRFDAAAREVLTERPSEAPRLREHPDFARAAPTPEHFLPLLYLAGLASAAGRPAQVLAEGFSYGSLSMTCYGLDAACGECGGDGPPAAPLPDPAVRPASDTNA